MTMNYDESNDERDGNRPNGAILWGTVCGVFTLVACVYLLALVLAAIAKAGAW
jgi:hypothetical protein